MFAVCHKLQYSAETFFTKKRQIDLSEISSAERLRQAGLRPTRQRCALADLLYSEGDRHVSAEMLHEEAARKGVPVFARHHL